MGRSSYADQMWIAQNPPPESGRREDIRAWIQARDEFRSRQKTYLSKPTAPERAHGLGECREVLRRIAGTLEGNKGKLRMHEERLPRLHDHRSEIAALMEGLPRIRNHEERAAREAAIKSRLAEVTLEICMVREEIAKLEQRIKASEDEAAKWEERAQNAPLSDADREVAALLKIDVKDMPRAKRVCGLRREHETERKRRVGRGFGEWQPPGLVAELWDGSTLLLESDARSLPAMP